MPTICLKYRLYPTPAQETLLLQTLDTCRQVYNSLLNWRKHDYERFGTSPSRAKQQKAFPRWKEQHPPLSEIHSQVLQNVAVRVEGAFRAFFRRCKKGETPGFPRFKGEGYHSFTYPQSGFKISERSVTLSRIGEVKAVVHRTLPGKVKTCTVRRKSEKWFACFTLEVEPEPLPANSDGVGIDVGLEKFAALSDGTFIENPRFFRKEEKTLAKAQRRFEKVKNLRRSHARRRAKKIVRRIHERIRNRRHDFVHQNARRIVNQFGLIALERLNVKGMSQRPQPKQDETKFRFEQTGEFLPNGASVKSGLNKSIQDAAWSSFRRVLSEKAASAGRQMVEINPAYTSQDCFGCGYRAKKPLKERWHLCPNCGLSLDRDTNAARNILKIGRVCFI